MGEGWGEGKQKTPHPHRDEEFSFDMLRTGLRGTTPNYVYRFERPNVFTLQLANVSRWL